MLRSFALFALALLAVAAVPRGCASSNAGAGSVAHSFAESVGKAMRAKYDMRFHVREHAAHVAGDSGTTGPRQEKTHTATTEELAHKAKETPERMLGAVMTRGKGSPRLELSFGPTTKSRVHTFAALANVDTHLGDTIDEFPTVPEPAMAMLETGADKPLGKAPAWAKVARLSYPANRVGKLVTLAGGYEGGCTATVISKHALLTSAHCASDLDKTFAAGDVVVHLGQLNAESTGKAYEVETFVWSTGYPASDALDVAALCVVDELPSPLRLSPRGADWTTVGQQWKTIEGETVKVVSYPGGSKGGETMWYDTCTCHQNGNSQDIGVHYCDTEPGSSGSSLLHKYKRGDRTLYEVAGVHTSSCVGDCNMFSNTQDINVRPTIESFLASCDETVKAVKAAKAAKTK